MQRALLPILFSATFALAQPVVTTKPAEQPKPQASGPRGPGPWDHDLLTISVSASGPLAGPGALEKATVTSKVFDRGGVASLCRDSKGRIVAAYQWFSQVNKEGFDKVAVRTSTNEGKTWSAPKVVTIKDLPAGMERPCDPTVVPLDDGRVRLYFTSHTEAQPAATYSAISDPANPLVYTFEAGTRFSDPPNNVLDCAVAKLGDTWHYFAPVEKVDKEGRLLGYHAVSKDGLTFQTQKKVTVDPPDAKSKLVQGHRWLGCAVTWDDGKTLRFFGTLNTFPGVWIARSVNGNEWTLESSPITEGVDPAVVQLKDGGLLVFATGPARAGTPSTKKSPSK